MKKLLLSAAFFAAAFLSNAQTENFDDAFPSGWLVNREMKLAKYDNPDKNNALDTGIVTPPITMTTPSTGGHLITTAPAFYNTTTKAVFINYDAYAFKGDTRSFEANADKNFKCNTQLKAYLVRATYTSDAVPTGTDVLGESNWVSLTSGKNALQINVTGTLVATEKYRVFVAGRMTEKCNGAGNQQAYVVDNIRITEALYNETFSSNVLPAGWDLVPGLSLTGYNTPQPGCVNDRGIATVPINFNGTNKLMTTAGLSFGAVASEAVKVRFDLFAYNANSNFDCAAQQKDIRCSTRVKVYIVDAANVSTGDVPTGTIYGQSEFVLMVTGQNEITIPITTNLVAGATYKLYVVGNTEGCSNANTQRYVFDNIGVFNAIESEDFSEVFPAGWNFNRELKITQYSAGANNCELNVGLTTAAIDGNFSNLHLMTSPATQYEPTTKFINATFNLFAYDADTRGYTCGDQETTLKCPVTVRAYLVAASYNSTTVPTSSQMLGQSQPFQLSLTNPNVVSVAVNGTINPNLEYKLIVFGSASGCTNEDPQVLVLDNIRIVEIAGAILPVTFTHFTAKRNGNTVELTWGTAMEENNRGFHVQRNIDGNWKNIGFVFSQADGGNSSASLAYAFNDANSSKGITQYRLLQVDHDNKGRYSEIRSVRAESQQSRVMVYPNPSNTGNVNVMFEDGTSIRDVIVTDVAGRVVKQYRNLNSNTLTIENLVDGYYTIQIANRTTAATTVEKVIIKKR